MSDTKQQIVEKITNNSNILIAVSRNPSVDELSAALGLTILINKLDKHATVIYSGKTPAVMEFLEPEKTFEDTVDSLRDFIIALDKEKADHLRYKVIDEVVKIFITPYRSTITEDDLEFSQGDYNVEMVVAIGVKDEGDLDVALESHGKILHDAVIASLSIDEPSKLGGIEWVDGTFSSYSEMVTELIDGLKKDKNLLDEQISTALLTGIVSATDRFSNSKTSPKAMTAAAHLMASGANQQLISIKLEEESESEAESNNKSDKDKKDDRPQDIEQVVDKPKEPEPEEPGVGGSLAIDHMPRGTIEEVTKQIADLRSAEALNKTEDVLDKHTASEAEVKAKPSLKGAVDMGSWKGSTEPAQGLSLGGTLNATTEQASIDKQRELSDEKNRTILSHKKTGYISEEPAYQSPLNATNSPANTLPSVPDILSQATPGQESHDTETVLSAVADTVATAPKPEPTLADIDASHRSVDTDSQSAEPSLPLPPLPPPPPTPDFSTLPPLPKSDSASGEGSNTDGTLGEILPDLPTASPATSSASSAPSSAQFQIPGA